MTVETTTWLDRWRQSYVYAEGRVPSDTDDLVAECVGDAEEGGITRQMLDEAAGGDLRRYILDATMHHSRETS